MEQLHAGIPQLVVARLWPYGVDFGGLVQTVGNLELFIGMISCRLY